MVVRTDPERARRAGRLRLGVLALVALLSAHTAIYAAAYGLGDRFAQAMSSAGHDGWWVPASVIVLGAGFIVLLHILGLLTRLEAVARTARAMDAGPHPRGADHSRFGPEVGAIWRRLFPVVTVLFAVQENLEHLVAHGHLLGLGALGGPESPLALPVLALVTLALSSLGALVRWRIATLRALVAIARRLRPGRPVDETAARQWRIVGELAPQPWMTVRLDAGRAPPGLLHP
jgi:hypothetical protein